jgi:hypothetical protein
MPGQLSSVVLPVSGYAGETVRIFMLSVSNPINYQLFPAADPSLSTVLDNCNTTSEQPTTLAPTTTTPFDCRSKAALLNANLFTEFPEVAQVLLYAETSPNAYEIVHDLGDGPYNLSANQIYKAVFVLQQGADPAAFSSVAYAKEYMGPGSVVANTGNSTEVLFDLTYPDASD